MSNWQRRARLLIAVAAAAFAVVVAFAFRGRGPTSSSPPVTSTDPKAVAESATGRTIRLNRDQEEVRIEYDKLLTYQDGSAKMIGVKIVTERAGGRTFTIAAKQGDVGHDESNLSLVGDVRLAVTDGLVVRTERATYTENGGLVHAPGPIEFARGRLSGTGLGMTYDKTRDLVTLLDQVVVRMAPDAAGAGGLEVTSGTAALNRIDHIIQFERGMKAVRGPETTEADHGSARLSPDEERLEVLELRGNSRMTGAKSSAGGLEAMSGRDIDLKYLPDGQTLEHVLIAGDAAIQLAGESGHAGRRITSNDVDIALGPDGSSPTALTARENVELSLPAEPGALARTIRAQTLDGTGEAGRGLTSARFSGNVLFRERGSDIDREARSAGLQVALTPGVSAIDEATFSGAVRFTDRQMTATAAGARYIVTKGTLGLSGTEPGMETPRVVNERLAVTATRIDVTLAGPQLHAVGTVKSEISPSKGGQKAGSKDTKLPAMLKPDQPVIVTADDLSYDSAAATAAYTGNAQLYQGETFIKGSTILIDENTGDLTASGSVTTAIALEQEAKDKRKERVRSVASATDLKYEEAVRRATYTGDAHVIGPQGDMTAKKIELYLKPSGEELERAEGYESVTLRDQNRKTTGARMTYFSADERYVVTGAPVSIVDQCGRDTTGKTLTFYKATDRIVVDGNEQFRTQTKGVATCP
jgi:LPS export ABC transporter protein LptC/lipopolysaccharide transport protein LptA